MHKSYAWNGVIQQQLDELVDIHEYVDFTWEGTVIYDVRRPPNDQPTKSEHAATEPGSDCPSECDGERSGIAAPPRAPRSLYKDEPEEKKEPEISEHFTVIYPPKCKNGLLLSMEALEDGGSWLPENSAQDWQVLEFEDCDTMVFSAELDLKIKVAYLEL